ncbi:hypothetical protein M080_7137, partial [Bacteroides fragilis str. 3397 T10]
MGVEFPQRRVGKSSRNSNQSLLLAILIMIGVI